MRVAALYRYPVKGLSPEAVQTVNLEPGEFFPGDRLYAIENGPSGFDPAAPVHQPKIKFLMLARNARLAALTTRYDAATTVLSIEQVGIEIVAGALATKEGRAAIERFFAAYCADSIPCACARTFTSTAFRTGRNSRSPAVRCARVRWPLRLQSRSTAAPQSMSCPEAGCATWI